MNSADYHDPDIPFMSLEDIWQKADDCRVKCFGDNYSNLFTFDLDGIVNRVGLEIWPMANLVSEHRIDGFLIYKPRAIVVDQDDYDNTQKWLRLRFTIAHEIGHYELHHEFFSSLKFESMQDWLMFNASLSKNSSIQWQADEFAGRFLVPPNHLRLLISREKETIDVTGEELERILIKRISRKFYVSEQVIEIRFQREGLKDFIHGQ